MVVLWTDIFLYGVVLLVLGTSLWACRRERGRAIWRRVFSSQVGVCAFIIMLGYISIGLLDSIHYQRVAGHGIQVVSVLDSLTGHLGDRMERSYSAPLTTVAFTKVIKADSSGRLHWKRPKLQYVDQSIITAQQRHQVILVAVLKACAITLFFAFLAYWLVVRQWHAVWTSGLICLSTLTFLGLTAFFLAQHFHVFGTDQIGVDILYKVLKSIRTGLVIGTVTTLLILPFALIFGCSAGYYGGWIDDVVQYIYTTISAIPAVLLIAAMVLVLQIYMTNHPEAFGLMIQQADVRLLFLCAILGLTSWTGLCRLLRGETLKLREVAFVQASEALGSPSWRVIMVHIIPNLMHLILITIILDFSGLVLAEAVLSYVGVGVDPTTTSWGTMINSARLELAREPVVWWPLAFAFLSMLGLVLSANLFAEVVRDALDPRQEM